MRGGLVDGVVFISSRLDSPMVSEIIDWKIPLVILNRDVDGRYAHRVDRVTSDNIGGGRLVADHLVDMGHTRIALISGPLENPSIRLREKASATGSRSAVYRSTRGASIAVPSMRPRVSPVG